MIKPIVTAMLYLMTLFRVDDLFAKTTNNAMGLGEVANNLMVPVSIVSRFMYGSAIVIGVTCLFAAFVRYLQHRVNPLAQPMSTIVTLLVLGLVLLCLPLIYQLTDSGIPYQ